MSVVQDGTETEGAMSKSKRKSQTGGTVGTNQHMIRGRRTICWDCANACGNCSWSARLEPVKGWEAEETVIVANHGEQSKTYCVVRCPGFERDAYRFGEVRMKKGETA